MKKSPVEKKRDKTDMDMHKDNNEEKQNIKDEGKDKDDWYHYYLVCYILLYKNISVLKIFCYGAFKILIKCWESEIVSFFYLACPITHFCVFMHSSILI